MSKNIAKRKMILDEFIADKIEVLSAEILAYYDNLQYEIGLDDEDKMVVFMKQAIKNYLVNSSLQ